MFDVIVGGGGPAGATAAEDLARSGHRVALLDRAGRIKPCGGAIPPRLIADFDIPDDQLVARITTARMPCSRACSRNSGVPLSMSTINTSGRNARSTSSSAAPDATPGRSGPLVNIWLRSSIRSSRPLRACKARIWGTSAGLASKLSTLAGAALRAITALTTPRPAPSSSTRSPGRTTASAPAILSPS